MSDTAPIEHPTWLTSGDFTQADEPLRLWQAWFDEAVKGEPRDPKKSAKKVDEESTAGRVVIWGEISTAPWCIVTEGIETAAAVAYALRSKIERSEAVVVSAINASGIEAFKPPPAAKRVTIAADRDEAAKITRPTPTRRGEQAARTFGIRNPHTAVSIALPGAPGTSIDWLDVHTDQGVEAVRAGILGAVAFVATQDEVEAERERIEGVDAIADVAARYPLPEMDGFALTYLRTKSGKIRVNKWVKVEDGFAPQPIASPFGVLARLRFADDGDAYGLRLVVEDMGGKCRKIDVGRSAFAKQGAAETRAMLFDAGLRTEDDGEHIAVKVLKAADPE